MDVLLATPVAVAVLIGSYGLSKWCLHHKDPNTNSHDLLFKCESMAVGIFFIGTSFLLKGLLGGFDCSRDQTNGKLYLDIDPGIECYTVSSRAAAAATCTVLCVPCLPRSRHTPWMRAIRTRTPASASRQHLA
eukprot:COSAG06_NODE_9718_length_1835_cov_4.318511_2_plen_133_part_00